MSHEQRGPDATNAEAARNDTQLQSSVTAPGAVALADLAAEINREHEAATTAIRTSLEHARRAGELLIQAKAQVEHGEFQAWIEANFRGSYRTAAIYVRIAKNWPSIEAKSAGSALSIDGAVKLLAEPRALQTGGASGDPPSERELFEQQQQLAEDRIWQQWALGRQLLALKAFDSLNLRDHDAVVAWAQQAAAALGHRLPLGETRESQAIGRALQRCEAVIEEHLPEVQRIFELSDRLTDALQVAQVNYPDRKSVV